VQRIGRVFHGKRAVLIGSIGAVAVVSAIAALVVGNFFTVHPHASPQSTKILQVKVTVATTEGAVKKVSPRPTNLIPVQVTAYTLEGKMADGKWTHVGACAVSTAQFPLGSIILLYNPDGTFNRQCVAEDTGPSVGVGDIDLAMPGDTAGAAHWGTRHLLAKILRKGWI
jgi:3D (Asp-Asp-Asp) domain-containing protein